MGNWLDPFLQGPAGPTGATGPEGPQGPVGVGLSSGMVYVPRGAGTGIYLGTKIDVDVGIPGILYFPTKGCVADGGNKYLFSIGWVSSSGFSGLNTKASLDTSVGGDRNIDFYGLVPSEGNLPGGAVLAVAVTVTGTPTATDWYFYFSLDPVSF